MKLSVVCAAAAMVPSVLSHALITNAYGNANIRVKAYGLGFLENTNRNSDGRTTGQRDCTVFSDTSMTPNGSGKKAKKCTKCPSKYGKGLYDTNCPACRKRNTPTGCGRTYYTTGSKYYVVDRPELKGTDPSNPMFNSGYIHTANWIEWMNDHGKIPQVTAGGYLWITMYQQTTDGAGPYFCMLDQTGTAENFVNITIPVESPGIQGGSPCANQNWEWPIFMPKDLNCQGKYGKLDNVCIARCQNDAPNGPFGGCVVFQQVKKGPDANKPPKSYETQPKCKKVHSAYTGKSITDGQIRFMMGDDSISPANMAVVRQMHKELVG